MPESWTPAEERAAKAIHAIDEARGIAPPWDRVPVYMAKVTYFRMARAALSAAAEGEPAEYQWGIRSKARHSDGLPFAPAPCDDETHARELLSRQLSGWELVRWRKAGPVEVVDGE